MRAQVREQECGGLRWLVVDGEREAAFRALGAAAREDVHAVQDALPEGGPLRRWAATDAGGDRLRRLREATEAAYPALAPGRHFVARGMQEARTLDEAVAGRVSAVWPDVEDPLHWHTNHLRHLPPLEVTGREDGDSEHGAGQHGDGRHDEAERSLGQYEESVARGTALEKLSPPRQGPDARWFIDALTGAPLPHGVHRTAAGTDPLMTLCTAVADLTADRVTFRSAHGGSATLPLTACARGEATPA